MRLLITRPENDATPLKAKLEALGHQAIILPLLEIVARPPMALTTANYQLVCATSANALTYFETADAVTHIPIVTLGPQSMAAARKAGFTKASAHGGDVHGLVKHILANYSPGKGPLLYLSGAETSADLQGLLTTAGFAVDRVIVYDAVAQDPPALAAHMTQSDGVLLYSPRTAQIWCDLIRARQLQTRAEQLHYFCLSQNVARMLPEHWPHSVAKTPDETSMLALLD